MAKKYTVSKSHTKKETKEILKLGLILVCYSVVLCTVLGPMMNINAVFTPDIFIQAFGIAIIVGIIGGLYPAVKAIKLPPTEALRYE